MAFGKTILVAGLLAASANSAFADNRQEQRTRDPNHPGNRVRAQNQQVGEDAPITAFSKEGKGVILEVDVPILNTGGYTKEQFQGMVKGGVRMAALTTLAQYPEADIPKNIDKIQKQITASIAMLLPMGTIKDGKMENGQPGVNYGNATVTRVIDATTKKVLLEQAAPTPKAPAAQSRKPGA